MDKKYDIKVDNIPAALQRIPAWAGFVVEDGKKKPVSIKDGKGVGANDKDGRLVDFATAKAAYLDDKVQALGVSLYGTEFTCIDIDCHDEENAEKFDEINKQILADFITYAETSISGKGTHLFVKAKKPEGYKHCDKYGIVEVYDQTRFIVTTGNIVDGHDTFIACCQEQLNDLCEKHLMKIEVAKGVVGAGQYEKSTELILEKLNSVERGKQFLEGKWQEVMRKNPETGEVLKAFPSQSEADLSFCSLILFFNGNNPKQAKEIFLKSGMWTPARKAKKSSGYVDHIVGEASMKCSKVYDWDRKVTPAEKRIAVEEILQSHSNDELVRMAKEGTLTLTTDKKLNSHLCKYIITQGSEPKKVMNTLYGDFDSSANGVRFWSLNKNDLIYIPDSNEWLAWNGTLWERCYDEALLPYAENVFKQLKHEAYGLFQRSIVQPENKDLLEQALELFEYAARSKNKRQCLEMISFSKSHFVKSQTANKVLEKLSANSNVINLENGIFDFDTMTLKPHSREFYQTKIANTSYDEKADCPLWKGFLEMVLPDDEVRKYLQKAVGYTLSSQYMEKCMFVLYGENGNNGKTTVSKTLHRLMGGYAIVAEKQTIMDTKAHTAGAPRPDLVRLRDRRFVCISESEKDDKLAEGLIKNLTGGGLVICRTLHHEPVEFESIFKMWLDTNYKPVVKGTDKALWNRLKIIPFDYSIPAEKIDTAFGEKLNTELSGILSWGIEGYKMYKAEGLEMPDVMKQIIFDYAEDMSSLDQWLKECICFTSKELTKGYTSKELYQSYKNWCLFNGEYAWTQRKFTQELNRKDGFKENTCKVQGYTKYMTVRLNEIGVLCFEKDEHPQTDFYKEYHKRVEKTFHTPKYEDTPFYKIYHGLDK